MTYICGMFAAWPPAPASTASVSIQHLTRCSPSCKSFDYVKRKIGINRSLAAVDDQLNQLLSIINDFA